MKLHGLAVAGRQHEGGAGPRSGQTARTDRSTGCVDREWRQVARPIDRRDRAVLHKASDNALCSPVSLPGAPGDDLLMRPSGPCSLNRITQSRSVSDPCRRSWRPLPVWRRQAPLQLPTIDAPAQHSSPAAQRAERHRSYSPSVPRWPAHGKRPSVCHLESFRS